MSQIKKEQLDDLKFTSSLLRTYTLSCQSSVSHLIYWQFSRSTPTYQDSIQIVVFVLDNRGKETHAWKLQSTENESQYVAGIVNPKVAAESICS